MARVVAALLAVILLAPAGMAAQDSAPQEVKKLKRNPDVISAEEIGAAPVEMRTALELVSRLRPNWMRKSRGEQSFTQGTPPVMVYVNDVRRGGPSALKEVDRLSIREIRRLAPTEASHRFGPDNGSGAILVFLR
jgi:hypothetical protein